MYLIKTPGILKPIAKDLVWSLKGKSKTLYLTFDDGPVPEVTPWVLEELHKWDAKATFFCLGKQVKQHPGIFRNIQSQGHTVGNHTFDHCNGWETEVETYQNSVSRCAELVDSKFFRPPYGRISRAQVKALKAQYRIIMWDVLSADFDQKKSGEKCARNVIKNANAGSIVVFHDSLKAERNLRIALPLVLEHFSEQGFRFHALDSTVIKAS